MEIRPIPVPSIIPPSRFAIPLVKDGNEWADMQDWESYRQRLERWGFACLASTASLSYDNIGKPWVRDRFSDHEVWVHPKGVIAFARSRRISARERRESEATVETRSLDRLQVHALLDPGHGAEVQQRAVMGVRGLGNWTPLGDGRAVREIGETVEPYSGKTLFGLMREIQRHGRLVPFEHWGTACGDAQVALPSEIILPLTDAALMEHHPDETVMEAHFNAWLDRFPRGVAQVLLRGRAQARKPREQMNLNQPAPATTHIFEQFTEAMMLARKRWPKPNETALLTHWTRVAMGELGDRLEPGRMRAYEEGPAGLSLAVALVHAKDTAKNAGGLLVQLLAQAPTTVLQRWATQEDAAGYTLGLRLARRIFTERGGVSNTDALDILHERLGTAGLVMATNTRSVLGLAMEPLQGRYPDLVKLIERLDAWGVAWDQHLRWRDYPAHFGDAHAPQFMAIDGPVEPGTWESLMEERRVEGMGAIEGMLSARRLDMATGRVGRGRGVVRRM